MFQRSLLNFSEAFLTSVSCLDWIVCCDSFCFHLAATNHANFNAENELLLVICYFWGDDVGFVSSFQRG